MALNLSEVEACRHSFAEAVEELSELLEAFDDAEHSPLAPDQLAQLRGGFVAAWEYLLDVAKKLQRCLRPTRVRRTRSGPRDRNSCNSARIPNDP